MDLRFFDTHTHYNDRRFDADLAEVLRKVRKAGVLRDTIIGYDIESSIRGIRIAENRDRGDGIKETPIHTVAVGIHPNSVEQAEEDDLIRLEVLAEDSSVVAIGEIGLDHYRKNAEQESVRERQVWFFRKQLRIARRAKLPVVIHSRDAAQDTVQILEEEKASEAGGVIHCYSYSPEMAEIFVKMGFFLGVGGVVTRPEARKLKETVERIPLSRLVLETDCPYLAPEGHRGERNDSAAIPVIAERIAELKGITVEEVSRVTWENACRLYRIDA